MSDLEGYEEPEAQRTPETEASWRVAFPLPFLLAVGGNHRCLKTLPDSGWYFLPVPE